MRRTPWAAWQVYGTALVVLALLVGGAIALLTDLTAPLAYLCGINTAALVVFGWDKGVASSRLLRVPEYILLAAAVCGATPAILLGQILFRHKTIKPSFRIRLWLIVLLQIAAGVALFPL